MYLNGMHLYSIEFNAIVQGVTHANDYRKDFKVMFHCDQVFVAVSFVFENVEYIRKLKSQIIMGTAM